MIQRYNVLWILPNKDLHIMRIPPGPLFHTHTINQNNEKITKKSQMLFYGSQVDDYVCLQWLKSQMQMSQM